MHSKGNKSFISKTGKMALREPEPIRLGRDTEKLVEFMEHEKREAVYLDQQIALLQDELKSTKSKKSTIFPTASSESQQRNKCSVLEKRIELEIIHLNETKAQCQLLRNEVNSYRKDKSHYKRTLQNIKEDINNFAKAADEKRQESMQESEKEAKYQKKIQTLRSRSMNEKSQYTEKVSEYSTFIQEKIEIRKEIHKKIEEGILGQVKKQSDSVEISKLQKELLSRWQEKLKDKKKTLDSYLRHLNVLQETFGQIKLATGINSVEEIVTAVIKSEEQNYEVYSYVNSLNSEIDSLKEVYDKTLTDIKELESQPKLLSNDKNDVLALTIEKRDKKKQKYENLFNQVQKLLPLIKTLLQNCTDSPLPLPKPSNSFQRIENIEYEQLSEFLGFIEENIGYSKAIIQAAEGITDDKKRETTPISIKEIEIKDVLSDAYLDELRNPLTVAEFQQRTLLLIKDNKLN